MNEAEEKSKVQDRKIAKNEAVMQATGDARVSIWAVAVAVVVGLSLFGWIWMR